MGFYNFLQTEMKIWMSFQLVFKTETFSVGFLNKPSHCIYMAQPSKFSESVYP